MTTFGISKSAMSIDLDNAKEHISLRVFETAVYSRHPLLHSRTTFYQLPWSISPTPTHVDAICSKSSHLPSLSTPLPASGLPTLPLIILSQVSATSFSFLRSHITRYSSFWSNYPSRKDLKVLPLPVRDSVVSGTSLSHLSHKHNTKQHEIPLLHLPDRRTSHLHSCVPFTSPTCLGAYFNTPLVVLYSTNNITRNYFVSTFFPFFPQRRETNIFSRASTQAPSLYTQEQHRQRTPQSCLWVGMPLLMPRCVYHLSFHLHLLTFPLPPPASIPIASDPLFFLVVFVRGRKDEGMVVTRWSTMMTTKT